MTPSIRASWVLYGSSKGIFPLWDQLIGRDINEELSSDDSNYHTTS
jgi:hypothetical protein